MAETKNTGTVFHSPAPLNVNPARTDIDRRALEKWIASLPKPAAIMTDWDYRAAQVIEICNHLRIRVPEQISVLGVDDDVLLCDCANPTISSIKPDHEQVGYRAAAALNDLMRRRAARQLKPLLCPIAAIIERGSTKPMAPKRALVKQAVDYIEAHACEGATVSDVVRNIGVSRSLADLRFREFRGHSILEELTQRRLCEVKRLLLTTDYSIKRISLSCGFNSTKHLNWLFKKHIGTSMRDFRQSS